MNKVGKMTFAR